MLRPVDKISVSAKFRRFSELKDLVLTLKDYTETSHSLSLFRIIENSDNTKGTMRVHESYDFSNCEM